MKMTILRTLFGIQYLLAQTIRRLLGQSSGTSEERDLRLLNHWGLYSGWLIIALADGTIGRLNLWGTVALVLPFSWCWDSGHCHWNGACQQ